MPGKFFMVFFFFYFFSGTSTQLLKYITCSKGLNLTAGTRCILSSLGSPGTSSTRYFRLHVISFLVWPVSTILHMSRQRLRSAQCHISPDWTNSQVTRVLRLLTLGRPRLGHEKSALCSFLAWLLWPSTSQVGTSFHFFSIQVDIFRMSLAPRIFITLDYCSSDPSSRSVGHLVTVWKPPAITREYDQHHVSIMLYGFSSASYLPSIY